MANAARCDNPATSQANPVLNAVASRSSVIRNGGREDVHSEIRVAEERSNEPDLCRRAADQRGFERVTQTYWSYSNNGPWSYDAYGPWRYREYGLKAPGYYGTPYGGGPQYGSGGGRPIQLWTCLQLRPSSAGSLALALSGITGYSALRRRA
jgi:hypothetical protein